MNSVYPIWWSDTITLYNRYEDPTTNVVTWYRTVINNCFWQNNFQLMKLGDVQLNSDSIICRIPANRNYVSRDSWELQLSRKFTLAHGDIIVRGAVDDTINEYADGQRSTDLIAKYKDRGCMVIERFSDDTGFGRGIPHYHIQGV